MLPQHGGVPNFSLRIPGPIKVLIAIILVTGLLLTLSFYRSIEPGDVEAENQARLSLLITLLLTFFVFLAGTGRWWYPHLWKHGNSQRQHRHRTKRHHSQSGHRHRR